MWGYLLLGLAGAGITLVVFSTTVRIAVLAFIDALIASWVGVFTGTGNLLTDWINWALVSTNTVGLIWVGVVVLGICVPIGQALIYNDAFR